MSIVPHPEEQFFAPPIGIMGGTFDPIHNGHLAIATSVADTLGLDEVLFIPTGNPSFKLDKQVTDGLLRAEMVELAVVGDERFRVDRREVEREGVTYSVDTLNELHEEYPGAQLFFIMGADSTRTIVHWKAAAEVAELCTVVAVSRPGFDDAAIREALEASSIAFDVRFVEVPQIDVSSTGIRERLAQGLSIDGLVPDTVAAYIENHGLYW